MNDNSLNKLLQIAIHASIEAGEKVMEVYNSADVGVEYKSDNSPLTIADKKSNSVIMNYLRGEDIPVLSEEGKHHDYNDRKKWGFLWLVDPLDGTKEFIKKNGEFTINIAFIKGQSPLLGVVYVPDKKLLYFGALHLGSYRIYLKETKTYKGMNIKDIIAVSEKLPLPKVNTDVFTIVGSRSHMSEETLNFIEKAKVKYKNVDIVASGSALKLCLVAEGSADIYPRFGPTMEWDTAAGHCIAVAAGYEVTQKDWTSPLVYNKNNLLNPWFIVKPKGFVI